MKRPNGIAGYGSPALETELQGIHIADSILGTDQVDPKMFLKAVRHHRIPVGGLLFAPLTEVELADPSKLMHLKDPEGSAC